MRFRTSDGACSNSAYVVCCSYMSLRYSHGTVVLVYAYYDWTDVLRYDRPSLVYILVLRSRFLTIWFCVPVALCDH